ASSPHLPNDSLEDERTHDSHAHTTPSHSPSNALRPAAPTAPPATWHPHALLRRTGARRVPALVTARCARRRDMAPRRQQASTLYLLQPPVPPTCTAYVRAASATRRQWAWASCVQSKRKSSVTGAEGKCKS